MLAPQLGPKNLGGILCDLYKIKGQQSRDDEYEKFQMNLRYYELKLFKKWLRNGTQTCELHNGGYIKKMYACRFNDGTGEQQRISNKS